MGTPALQCEATGKRRHATEAAAEAERMSLQCSTQEGWVDAHRLNVYPCQACHGYHVGHAKRVRKYYWES